MPLTTAGRNFIANTIINNGSPVFFDNTNAKIGVGDDVTAFDVSHTNLQAVTNKLRKAMDGGYPSIATNVITFRSTFTTGEANYTWAEWGTFNNVTDATGDMLTRKVEALGTKTSAQTWEITVDITVLVGA